MKVLPHIPFCLYSSVRDNKDKHDSISDIFHICFQLSDIGFTSELIMKDWVNIL